MNFYDYGIIYSPIRAEQPTAGPPRPDKPLVSEDTVAATTTRQVPLSALTPGQKGVITAIRTSGPLRRRLLDMGLVRGEMVYVERVAPLGDPVEYTVKGSHLSLRRKDAADIIVEIAEAEPAHEP